MYSFWRKSRPMARLFSEDTADKLSLELRQSLRTLAAYRYGIELYSQAESFSAGTKIHLNGFWNLFYLRPRPTGGDANRSI